MLRTLRRKKGQNTLEYALLISLVVGGVIAMQTYSQRTLQARIKDAGDFLVGETTQLGSTSQYEPYYLNSEFNVTRDDEETMRLDTNLVGRNEVSNRQRQGFQRAEYEEQQLPGQ
jgi:hypothetical protein